MITSSDIINLYFPFRRALEENLIDASHSIQVGMRGSLYDPDEHKMAAELGMKLIPAHKVREMGCLLYTSRCV